MSKKTMNRWLFVLVVLGIVLTIVMALGYNSNKRFWEDFNSESGFEPYDEPEPPNYGRLWLGIIVIGGFLIAYRIATRGDGYEEDEVYEEPEIKPSQPKQLDDMKQKMQWIRELWSEGKQQEAFALLQTLPDGPTKERLTREMQSRMK